MINPVINNFFHPTSVAIIGASSNSQKIGNAILRNVLFGDLKGLSRSNGFQGSIYPVNLHEKEILGLKCYPSVNKIPGQVDLACVVVPAKNVAEVVKGCGEKGIRAVVIISAGFAESDENGKKLQSELVNLAKKYKIRIIGPNCLGIISSFENLNLTFARVRPDKGPIAFISQSGAFGTAVIEYSLQESFGISYFISLGNKCDINDSDLLEYFADDPGSKCISIYLESVKNGREFYDTMRSVTPKKPVVILKSGVTKVGARAVQSHTGSLSGADTAYDAAIKQAGAQRARTMYELFDASRALAYQPHVLDSRGIAIVTNAGGPGIIAADKAYELGLPLANLSNETISKITSVCPPTWSKSNPVDIIGDATPERYKNVMEVLNSAPEVGGIIVICSRQALTQLGEIVEYLVQLSTRATKPLTVSLVGIVSQDEDKILEQNGIPVTEVSERAVKAMHALYLRGKILERLKIYGN